MEGAHGIVAATALNSTTYNSTHSCSGSSVPTSLYTAQPEAAAIVHVYFALPVNPLVCVVRVCATLTTAMSTSLWCV